MKVYRCLNKDERKLFDNGVISLRISGYDYSKKLNTHDYSDNHKKMHFFLFKEDALRFNEKYLSNRSAAIGEFEIDDDIVLSSLGVGIYLRDNLNMAPEIAISFTSLLTDQITIDYLNDRSDNKKLIDYCNHIVKIKKYCGIESSLSQIGISNICRKSIEIDDITYSEEYNNFIEKKAVKYILNSLNVGFIKDEEYGITFDTENKIVNENELKNVLIEYNIIEKSKTKKLDR